jgi:hypothetical protein
VLFLVEGWILMGLLTTFDALEKTRAAMAEIKAHWLRRETVYSAERSLSAREPGKSR